MQAAKGPAGVTHDPVEATFSGERDLLAMAKGSQLADVLPHALG